MAKARSIVIVSNRLPVTRSGAKWQTSVGGLVTALMPIAGASGGKWIGWLGGSGVPPRPFEHEGVALRPVPLSSAEINTYYHGYCNRTLWPLFHDAIRTPEFEGSWWRPFVEVNRRFARAAARACGRGERVWVHDYHLMLVPAMLRAMRPDLRIGFFLHIPFPPEELFLWLPQRRELLQGVLGSDVVGFQTHDMAQNFSRLARRLTSAEGTDRLLEYEGRSVVCADYPISIDFDWFNDRASDPEVKRQAGIIRQRLGSRRQMLLSVDRLDYTKGIDARLKAFEKLLDDGRLSVDDCVLVQICAPSREDVREYARMRMQIDEMVGSINGSHSEPGRVAVHYFRRTFSREEIVPYYVAADAILVTPLRDGMNLVAKEYIACRSENDGALVLSEFAGAAVQLRQALLVNPRDVEGTAQAIEMSLRMKQSDARFRMAVLRSMVRRHDVHDWARLFLEDLRP